MTTKHDPGPVKVIGYVRVSTEEQSLSGAGLSAQRAAIVAESARRGWTLLEIVEDAGFSGRDLRRPGIAAALAELREKRATAMVVAKLDRLSRSLLDSAALMDRSAKEGWALVAIDLGVDTSTPSGEAMASVMTAFAQLERRLIGQRTKEALAVRRSEGVVLGRPRSLSDAVVARVVAERSAGWSLRVIAGGLNDDAIATAHGGVRWYPSTVRAALRSFEGRARAGPVASGERRSRGRHPPSPSRTSRCPS